MKETGIRLPCNPGLNVLIWRFRSFSLLSTTKASLRNFQLLHILKRGDYDPHSHRGLFIPVIEPGWKRKACRENTFLFNSQKTKPEKYICERLKPRARYITATYHCLITVLLTHIYQGKLAPVIWTLPNSKSSRLPIAFRSMFPSQSNRIKGLKGPCF